MAENYITAEGNYLLPVMRIWWDNDLVNSHDGQFHRVATTWDGTTRKI